MRTLFLSIVILASLIDLSHSEERIKRIEIIGNERIEKGVILSAIKTKEGDPFDLKKLREDLKSIYKIGFFSDVQLDVTEEDGMKVVRFVVIERPIVKAINVYGNKRIKISDIKDKIKVKPQAVLNIERVKESVEEIKKLYTSKGYYGTKVEYEIVFEETYDVSVNFRIEEAREAYIKKIQFSGVKSFKEDELKKILRHKEKGIFSWFTGSGILDEELFEEDRRIIEAFYLDRGYVNVKTSPPEVEISKDGKSIYLKYRVEEGSKFSVGEIRFSGDLIMKDDDLKNLIQTKTGQTFSYGTLQKDVLKIGDLYRDRGYAFCEVIPLTNVDEDRKKIDLTFEIKKNQEVFVNRINIMGNVKTLDKVIRRELRFAEGDRFSSKSLEESKRRLRNTTYFKEVDLKIVRTERPDLINVDVVVEERPTGTLSLGVGYSTAEKGIISGSISQENLFGTGRKLYLDATLSASSSDFRITAQDPYFLDKRLLFGISASNYRRMMDTYDYRIRGGSILLSRPMTDYTNLGVKLRHELNQVYNVKEGASKYVKAQEGKRTTNGMTLFLNRNTIDDILNPTKGDFGEISVENAGGIFGGSVYFVRSLAYYGRYIKIGFLESSLMIKGTLGAIWPYGGKDIPIYEKFFVGGINTVRGFKYGEAGPKDEEGQVIGGKNQAFFNLEWIFPIFKPAGLKGVLFFDMGHGFDEASGFFRDYRYAAGFGLRWLSPLGPIRLELGFNLSPRKGEKRSVFDFMIGTFY